MSIENSLFKSALPHAESREGKAFFAPLALPKHGKPDKLIPHCKVAIALAETILEICQGTVSNITKHRYSKFDPLVKNFGCQISALQNHTAFQNDELFEEAVRVKEIVKERLAEIEKLWNCPPPGKNQMSLLDYLDSIKLDIALSPRMIELVRFRILNIINTNVVIQEREVPRTDVGRLIDRVKRLERPTQMISFENWIEILQAEESKNAVAFIQAIAQRLIEKGEERAPLIARMLNDKHVRKVRGSSIVSNPQLYTAEATLRAIDGIVLIKNKLSLGDVPIADAEPMKVYVKMPEERMLSLEEVERLPLHTPLVVLEGYVKNGTDLSAKVKEFGVLPILLATIGKGKRYASNTSFSPFEDREADQEWDFYRDLEPPFEAIELDHMYCASVEEEL